MIATYAPSRWSRLTGRVALWAAVGFISLVMAAALIVMQELALGVVAFAALVGLIVWRPRYGVYAAVLLSVPFDPAPNDPFMYVGWLAQTPLSSWSPMKLLIFAPIELILVITTFVVVVGAAVERRPLKTAQLWWPLIVFTVLLAASVGYGMFTGGIFNIAMWETRWMFAGCLLALLVPNVFTGRQQVHTLINLLTIAVVLLSLDIIWRRYTLLADIEQLDLMFAHDTPIFMNFVVIFLLARLIWPASGGQRAAALLIPLVLYAQMVTERRAGWVSLDVGLVLIAIFIFRLRRKVFWFVVVPCLVVYIGYLAAFWNAEGPIAQPARAIRSINNPEGRDVASNLYRITERANVRLNIKAHPLTGVGFGKQYAFYYGLPDLSWWPFWHYIAHSQILWLWMKIGPLGFITFLTLVGGASVRGVQLLKRAANDRSAPYLVAMVSGLLMLLVYCYVDLGLNSPRVMALMGLVVGVIGTWGREAEEQGAAS